MIYRGVVLGALVTSVAGCGTTWIDAYSCPDPDKGRINTIGTPGGITVDVPDPCHEFFNPGPNGQCLGECVPKAPVSWDGPDLLWMGPPAKMPACPQQAPRPGFTGYADPTGLPLDCPKCECNPPTGKCVLPEQIDVFNVQMCQGMPVTSFDAPPNWDGSCTTKDAIPKGQLCNGLPCVQSIRIHPPTIEATCAVANPPPPTPARTPPPGQDSGWGLSALACLGEVFAACPNKGDVCVPTSEPPPPGFHQCISHEGEDEECTLEYPNRHVFYKGSIDSRACTECTCGAPVGGECKVKFTTYEGAQCGQPSLDHPGLSSNIPAQCYDMGGIALAGKTAKVSFLDLGTCTPNGSQPTGELKPEKPTTFCCR